ncbi:tetratricopeptide repeat protein [Suttonella ornithocola]|uniref:Tetratricopeptide repeat n=1 Tax=Suttonella ornithocola TaxID=279832 RepID=A0A380MRV0_9GAMM|nr:tetratricopeptide repeat protein [Suttonella ornithocola]SUO94766.1 Tetratricopeptide repeat [Suttonella ornithocola]
MKRTFLLAVLFPLSILVHTEPYRAFEFETIKQSQNNGQVLITLDPIFEAIDQLWQHAKGYPPQFDNEQDKATAKKDAIVLNKLLTTVFETQQNAFDAEQKQWIILNLARISTVAHNLDIPHAWNAAEHYYQRLLQQQSTPALEEEYGVFFANSGNLTEGKKWLEKALKHGQKSANFGLAIVAFSENQPQKAQKYLKQYLKHYPNDNHAQELLKALADKKLTVNKCQTQSTNDNPTCQIIKKTP